MIARQVFVNTYSHPILPLLAYTTGPERVFGDESNLIAGEYSSKGEQYGVD